MSLSHWSAALVFAAASLGLAGTAQAQAALSDTHWIGDSSCFVTDIYFYADGTADIYYTNDDEYDETDWKLNGSTLTLMFTYYTDTFVANYDGSAIRAAHSYMIKNDNTPHTENCVFSLGS